MKVKLVFEDWRNNEGRSVYSELTMLSTGGYHSGTTFNGEINLTTEQEDELKAYMKNGYRPVFWVLEEKVDD
jgi:hypothetical protein